MADDGNASGRRNSIPNIASTTARASHSPLRHRPFARASTLADVSSAIHRRRSSFMTAESVDRLSIRSSTDGLLLPRPAGGVVDAQSASSSHLHSAPLALALLPALGGLFIKNGSAIITDVTLLILAAILLNWSVRVPWEWYLSTQTIRVDDVVISPSATILEEPHSPDASPSASRESLPPKPTPQTAALHASASEELRLHELLALLACFLSPFLGAILLHAIRSQLSRPSEGLVSNYNLTIFLLGSELRPLSHLIQMIQSRTLHLQRQLAINPFDPDPLSPSTATDLRTRIDELEAHVASTLTATSPTASQPNQISNDVRKSLQPELDALNRAVRRYEKRATLLAMQTEARLQELEARMTDAITLAAAAERGIASKRQGSAAVLLDWVCAAVVVPARVVWVVLGLPGRVSQNIWGWMKGWVSLGGKPKAKDGRAKIRGQGVGRGGKKVA